MNLDETRHLFILESRELLESMENALLALARAEDETEPVNAIFRAAHTIKGSAGLFALDRIVAFTHVVESVLDRVREGRLPITPTLVSLLLACGDHIGGLIDAVELGTLDTDEALQAQGTPMLQQLHAWLGEAQPVATEPAATASPAAAPRRDDETWHISLRFGRDVLRNGMDPLSFIRYLDRLGTVDTVETLTDALPPLAALDPEACYLGFDITLRSTADQRTIEDVFEFVREDCDIRIRASARDAAAPTQPDVIALPSTPSAAQGDAPDAAPLKAQPTREARTSESRSIRVDADKLDRLINLVGELIIAAASTDLEARRARSPVLQECTSTLTDLVESVRDSALQLRMVKIGATFNRFQRVVHDVSRELGKDIALVVHGEDTELDKTVVEKIGDPLTHLVRNAMDHGIEPAELRAARGKPAGGTVTLNAFHESGSIVIEVSDDGGGLKRERIFAKAVERGLVDANAILSDSEIYGLIFEPGFSTAEQVTNLSGRGVGMDVVKRNITALRGSVAMHSEEGVGTTVSIRLPLTLAIIDGFLVGLGGAVFVVPVDTIEECVDFSAEPGHDYTNLRGEVLPFISLRRHFDIEGAPPTRQNIVVVKHAGHRMGLVVDALLGEFQTVIKPLGRMFSHVKCISGSTILGSGEIALILDVAALFQHAGHAATRTNEQRETSALAG